MTGLTLTKDVLTDFGYTIKTEVIDLSNQNIGDVDINAFEEYEELTKINLSGNLIEFVDRSGRRRRRRRRRRLRRRDD